MTSRIIRYGDDHPSAGRLQAIVIACDHMECTHSLDDKAIHMGGGLKEMGWSVALIGHKLHHYCPEHKR